MLEKNDVLMADIFEQLNKSFNEEWKQATAWGLGPRPLNSSTSHLMKKNFHFDECSFLMSVSLTGIHTGRSGT